LKEKTKGRRSEVGKAIEKIVEAMERGSEIHFGDLVKVCEHFFGAARHHGTSHQTFKTPWIGYPRNAKGKAKPYQVGQVLAAIVKLKAQQEAVAAKVKAPNPPKKK
jgi:hypothetical protein